MKNIRKQIKNWLEKHKVFAIVVASIIGVVSGIITISGWLTETQIFNIAQNIFSLFF
jgi:hypothetical protein